MYENVWTTPVSKHANLILNHTVLTNPKNKSWNANNQSNSYAHRQSSEISEIILFLKWFKSTAFKYKKKTITNVMQLVASSENFVVLCFFILKGALMLETCVYFFCLKYSAHECNTYEDNVYTSKIKKGMSYLQEWEEEKEGGHGHASPTRWPLLSLSRLKKRVNQFMHLSCI